MGYHEHRERWFTDEWFWYQPNPRNNQQTQPISKEEALKLLQFNIPNESLWSRSEEGSYTALNQIAETAFAWSDEIIDGDFILIVDITSSEDSAVYPIN